MIRINAIQPGSRNRSAAMDTSIAPMVKARAETLCQAGHGGSGAYQAQQQVFNGALWACQLLPQTDTPVPPTNSPIPPTVTPTETATQAPQALQQQAQPSNTPTTNGNQYACAVREGGGGHLYLSL